MDISDFVQKFENQFENAPAHIFKPETQFRDVDGWDSMLALSIMAMIDEEYDVKITPNDIRSSQTIQELFNIVISKK